MPSAREPIPTRPDAIREFAFKLLRFGVVGGSATLLYGIFVLALHAMLPLPPLAEHSAAYALAVPVSYLGQRTFTFRYRGPEFRAMRRFLLTVVLAYVVSTVAVYLCGAILGLPFYYGTVVTMGIVPVISFLTMLLWVFIEPKEQDGIDAGTRRTPADGAASPEPSSRRRGRP
jgi:putative flippase GtrA